jgi:broad specificity phosphatase PhoE
LEVRHLASSIYFRALKLRTGYLEIQIRDFFVDGFYLFFKRSNGLLPACQHSLLLRQSPLFGLICQLRQTGLTPRPTATECSMRFLQLAPDRLVELDPVWRIARILQDLEGQFLVLSKRVRCQIEGLARARQVLELAALPCFADLLVNPTLPIPRTPRISHLDTPLWSRYNATICWGTGQMIRIILVRHGRTAWNVGPNDACGLAGRPTGRFRGTIDLPLASEGISQARFTAQRLANLRVDAVYSSPLQRAAHTAQIISRPHSIPVQTLPGLGSMDYGDWAGQSTADVARRWPTLYRQWRDDSFAVQIPGGECLADLRERAVVAVTAGLDDHADGETLVLVTHQVVAKTLVCAWAKLPDAAYWHFRQDLANLSTFDYDPTSRDFTLAGLNDTCHLGPALPRRNDVGTRLILIRHGQTAWNASPSMPGATHAGEERFRGRTDLPLDDTGQAQAIALADRLEREPMEALYASPLLRTQQTIAPLADRLELPIEPEKGLLDINYGRFQGLTHSEAAAAHPEPYSLWRTTPSQARFPGGECLADVQDRILALLQELPCRHPQGTVALAGHQIVNKVAACTLLGLDLDQIWRIQQDPGGMSVFQQVGDVWHTLRLNDVCHL